VDLPPLVLVEATGVCIPIGNSEILLESIYKSPGRVWSEADITQLLGFRRKSILAGYLNAKHPFWNIAVSNPSGEKLMAVFNLSEFEISAPKCPIIILLLEMVTCWILRSTKILVSDITLSDIFYSDHLPIIFHILDHVKIRNLSEPIEKFTDWDRLKSPASKLESPKIEINLGVKAKKRRASL
jgi:hypothetical protein